jgi:hypothetical protein
MGTARQKISVKRKNDALDLKRSTRLFVAFPLWLSQKLLFLPLTPRQEDYSQPIGMCHRSEHPLFAELSDSFLPKEIVALQRSIIHTNHECGDCSHQLGFVLALQAPDFRRSIGFFSQESYRVSWYFKGSSCIPII